MNIQKEESKKWGWSYAIIRERKSSGRWGEFILKEIYGKETPEMWSDDGTIFGGDTPEEIIKSLNLAIKDIEEGMVLEVVGKKLRKVKL